MAIQPVLLESQFQAVGEILKGIKSRGGALTICMVSKVLQRIETDLASSTTRGVLAMREHPLWQNDQQLPVFLGLIQGIMA